MVFIFDNYSCIKQLMAIIIDHLHELVIHVNGIYMNRYFVIGDWLE